MYQLHFKLKQHTPIIHFQHTQVGATLRATEVKPKLDRFIIEKMQLTKIIQENGKNKVVPKEEYKSWFINEGKQHLALDYKMRIEGSGSNSSFFYTSNPDSNRNDLNYTNTINNAFKSKYINKTQYFGNNSNIKIDRIENKEEVKLGIIHEELSCIIICFKDDLLKEIENNLCLFFLSQNFGTRQSKGFGCFTISELNKKSRIFDENKLLNSFQSVYKYNSEINDFNNALQKIANTYQLIRSGQGQRAVGGYKKSILFLYFVNKTNPIRWEKRKIKQSINSNKLSHRKRDNSYVAIDLKYTHEPCFDSSNGKNWIDAPNPYAYNYIRALLGLNEGFEFQTDEISDKNYEDRDIQVKYTYVVKVKSNQDIDRFPSPLTWKYYYGNLYLCANPINPKILNSSTNPVSFNFDLKLKKGTKLIDKNFAKKDNFIKNIPTPESFDITDFLKFCFETCPTNEKITDFTILNNNA